MREKMNPLCNLAAHSCAFRYEFHLLHGHTHNSSLLASLKAENGIHFFPKNIYEMITVRQTVSELLLRDSNCCQSFFAEAKE